MERTKLSAAALKSIALLSMTLDHAAIAFARHMPVWAYYLLRTAGRPAFVIFCFFVVQGYLATKNVGKYALRIGIFALVSEMPFDLFIYGKPFSPEGQNVMITLLLGLLCLWSYDKLRARPAAAMLCTLALCAAAYALKSDYGMLGALLIFTLYLTRGRPAVKYAACAPLLFFIGLGAGIAPAFMQLAGLLGLMLCEKYGGRRGPKLKYLFYIYYPAHMLLLWLI